MHLRCQHQQGGNRRVESSSGRCGDSHRAAQEASFNTGVHEGAEETEVQFVGEQRQQSTQQREFNGVTESSFTRRLLRPLHLGLPVLRVPDTLQHGGGAGLVRRLHVGGMLLLLLLRRPRRRLQQPLRHGLWHHGRLLRVIGLPGDLHGVLRHLLPHIESRGEGGRAEVEQGAGVITGLWMEEWKETAAAVALNSAVDRGNVCVMCVE